MKKRKVEKIMSKSKTYRSKIVARQPIAINVNAFVVESPKGFTFRAGQAVELAIDQPGWRDRKHPFTMTSLPDNPCLEFIIKSYPVAENPDHSGMTEHLGSNIQVGDHLLFGDAWGAIEYRGPGVFIAGGAGITPFIAILRQLEQNKQLDGNHLFFSNRVAADVILQNDFTRMLGDNAVFTLTGEQRDQYQHGRIDRNWIETRVKDFDQPFYLCGPPTMVEDLSEILKSLGADADSLIFEK